MRAMKIRICKLVLAAIMVSNVLIGMPVASALSTVDVSTQNLMNANFMGAPVKASSSAVAAVKVSVTNATAAQTLTSVQANFSGEGFVASDLEAIATGNTSGVALYGDNGSSVGSFDGGDSVVTLAASPDWTVGTTNITLTPATPVALNTSGANIFYVVFKTSGTVSDGDRISVSIPVNGVVTSDGSGPASQFNANYFRADTQAPSISTVSGFPGTGATTVTVRFTEPVQKATGGNLSFVGAGDPFTFTDNGTTSTHTISSVSHTAGQDMAVVTLSGDLDSGDFDGSPSTIAAGSNKIADFAGNVIDTTAKGFSSPLTITTAVVPTTFVGQVTDSSAPLVTFAANGGTSPYTFSTNGAADSQLLTDLGLSLAANGKLTGTTANVTGSFNLNVKVTDSTGTPLTATKFFNINVAATSGGGVPGISSINPPGGKQASENNTITITGSNTSFSNSSTVSIALPPGGGSTNGIGAPNGSGAGSPTVTFNSATSLTVSFSIKSNADLGPRDIQVTTGGQVVTMPNAFGVFADGGSGLNLQFPAENATNVQIPPGFSFSPSTNSSVASYRIVLKSTSDFSGTALWDYTFPKPTEANPTLCNATDCNLIYGNGQYRTIKQPSPLSPNTTYFWQVKTYSATPENISDASEPLEVTPIKGFTTVTSITDTVAPTIMHRPVAQATESANLVIFARITDNVATNTTSPALGTSVFYCAGSGCSPTTEASGTYVGSGYFKFTIPSTTISTAGTIVRYYLKATDGTNVKNFKQADGSTPFQLTAVATGSSTIAGTVKDGSNNCDAAVRQATIFAEGTGFSTTSSNDADCTFTITGLLSGIYDLIAVKDGYADRIISGIAGGSSGIGFKLSQGSAGGFGGDTTKPRVKFNGPMDGMTGIPGNDTNFKVFVAFDKSMSQASVTAVGNMQVNEVNPSTGVLTDITTTKGSWTYYSTAPNAMGVPPEANMAVWAMSGGNTLGDGKTIAVIVKPEVTDTAGNGVQGNQPDGSYAFSFTTGATANFSGFNSATGGFAGGGTFGQGAFVPPHIEGTTPPPGAFDVPRNAKFLINFSEAMADDTSDCTAGYCLKNNVKLFTVSNNVETDVTTSAIDTVSLDTSKKVATVSLKSSYNSGTFAASTRYRLKIYGSAKAATGITLAPPTQATAEMFMSEFKTSAVSDTTAPTILGSFPDSGATSVPVNVGSVHLSFNKDMNPSTITTSTFYLSLGSTAVNGTVEYKPLEKEAIFIPKTALSANTTYTLNLAAGIQGLNGQAITATTRSFTTGAADTGAPAISFINVDDYGMAVTFSEPMNAAKALDTLNWDSSVINPATYNVLKYGPAGFNPDAAGTTINLDTATFTYEAASNTVLIQGLNLKSVIGQEIYISMDITGTPGTGAKVSKDLSGNLITSAGNTARAPIQNSANTGGALGPMASKESAFSAVGGFTPDNFDSATFGFAPPIEVRPFNMMAGQTTIYGVRLPISKQIPAGGTIVLTFPTGFDVSGAKQDVYSPMRTDLNGPGTGTITFKCTTATGGTSCGGGATVTGDTSGGGDSTTRGGLADDGVVVNTSSRTVTVNLSAATSTAGNDFLNIDLDGIKNSSVPKDFNTSGYTVDVKTKDSSTVLESLTSGPFFIQSAGSYTLSGTVTATANDQNGTVDVYLMSPMTGPMKATTADFAAGTTGNYSFTNLSAGDYMLFTDQSIAIGSKEFVGMSIPQRIVINETADTASDTVDNDVIDKDFTLASATSTGTTVTINIDGPNAELLDIFASSPTGFKVKQVTLDSSAGAEAFTMKLPDGTWQLGVGPQMPKGFAAGPPPAPSYLPPKPKELKVTDPACVIDGTVGCSTTITLTTSNKSIKGVVKDGNNKVMANAEVYAYSPNAGFGTHAQADASGNFTLSVVEGSFIVGSFIPGMPPSKEVPVGVTSAAVDYLLIDGATTAVSAATAATTFVLKVAKPDYTISGKVTDGTNVIQGASVYAYRTDGPGHANANTDSSGNYTLYVSTGSWKVGAFLPGYGNLSELSVSITTASASNQNFSPSLTGTFRSVSGTVTSGGTAVQGAFVRITGNNTFNETTTGSDGTYSFKIPEGNGYQVRAFIPGVGETPPLASFNVSGSDVSGKDITVATPRTITVTLSSSVTEAFVEVVNSTGMRSTAQIKNGTVGTLSLPDGSYAVKVYIPGMNINVLTDVAASSGATVYSSTTGIMTVNGNEGLTVTLPTLRTVTGTVRDGSGNLLSDAWVELTNPTAGIHFGTKTDTNGAFSLKAADGTYGINAMKPGYFREPSSVVVNAATAAQTLTVTTASTTIAGQVKVGSTGVANAFVRAEKQGGGFAGTQADANGNYTLYVTSGVWKVFAVGEGYAEAAYASNPIDVSTGSVTSKDITLTTAVSLDAPFSKPITPATGGTLEDSDAGVTITVPANAFGSDNDAGNLQAKETNNVRETSSAKPVGGKAQEIKATDSSGSPITTLNDDVTIDMEYTVVELAATESATDTSIDTLSEVESLKMAYWDETTATWVTQSTTITYLDASDNVITDSTSIDTAAEFDATVSKVKFSTSTDHFSLFAPVVSTDAEAPDTPAGLAATAASTTQINLSWNVLAGATSGYDIYRSTTSGGVYSRLGAEPTVANGATVTYSDTGLTAGTTYYYKISALNASGESAASAAVAGTTTAAASSSSGGGTITTLGGGGGGGSKKETTAEAATTDEADESAEATAESTSESEETTATMPFVDSLGHWAQEYIEDLFVNEIVSGKDASHFAPNDDVSRAEFAKMIVKAFDIEMALDAPSSSSFKDVKLMDWFVGYVEAALKAGLVGGYKDGTFKPNSSINRAEALKMLLEAADAKVAGAASGKFGDVKAGSWYSDYVGYAVTNGIVNGYKDGTFGPEKNITRAEAAKIISVILGL